MALPVSRSVAVTALALVLAGAGRGGGIAAPALAAGAAAPAPAAPAGEIASRVPAASTGEPAARAPAIDAAGLAARAPAADTTFWFAFFSGAAGHPLLARDRPLTLGLGRLPLLFSVDLPGVPGGDDPWLLPPGTTWTERWLAELEAGVDRSRRDLRTLAMAGLPAPGARETSEPWFLPPREERSPLGGRPAGEEGDVMPALLEEHSDLAVRLVGRAELGGEWTRFRPCDPTVEFRCSPDLFPQVRPDLQFGVRVAGTLAERIRLDVDYDQTREFAAANNINIYFEGREDEIIQRLEVGDVTFDLPPSRFLTQGIPAGNFGFQARGQLGPMDFQAVWAQQKGDLTVREFRLSDVGGEPGFVQSDTLVLDDADYVTGQFFFLVHPRLIADYPHVDVLSLDPSRAPATVSPGPEPIQLYRFESDPVTRQQVEGYIQADAVASSDGDVVTESGWARYLQPGIDYFVHPSGLWLALRRPLRREEMLAVTYITVTGDTVGDYNPERIHNQGGRPRLRLLKASGGLHQPGRPTWELEMHQVYRVSGSDDVEPTSVELAISLGELSAGRTFKRSPGGDDVTLLRLMGLDEEAPLDRIDRPFVYQPADETFQEQPPVSGTFIIFPTLRPFAEPPPVRSLGLSAFETGQILGSDANPRIYENPDPFERDNGGLFRLTVPFRVRSQGVISSFSLGAFGIRDGSERIFLGDRLLTGGVDYTIDYDVGQVTLLDPEGLFAAATDPVIRASWEQKSIFQTAPTTVAGLTTTFRLGEHGSLDLLGLVQRERSLVNRPRLGVEPAAIAMGGANGSLELGIGWLDRALEQVPGLDLGGESSLSLGGELAVSLPDPNVEDDVFLDDFDTKAELPLSLVSEEWVLGSAPELRDGADALLPAEVGPSDATSLVWQHQWIQETIPGDSLGVFQGYFPRTHIDQEISVAGSEAREAGLRLTFGGGGGGGVGGGAGGPGERAWRSVTTVLSTTGLDLTRSEFLEFYAARGQTLTLIIDLGRVSEDAMFIDDQGGVNGVKETGVSWGLGFLDQEADPRRGEIWSDAADERGVWGESCLTERARVYPIGDPRANCTRGNGLRDSEDLDSDGNLDTAERTHRYVVRLDGSSPYLARTRSETGTPFQLYRIPLTGPRAVNVGGLVTEADRHSVKHLRLTLSGERADSVILARMRIVGSRWLKRQQDGVLEGIAGEIPGAGGRVESGPVSALSAGGAYQAPPGVLEQLDDPAAGLSGQGVEFGERALSVQYAGVAPGERVEVYHRFPQRPRDLLTYRQARLWVVARDGEWGPDEDVHFFVKVGTDAENFYLYRTRLTPAANPSAVIPEEWLPEVTVDFERWLALRREAEERLIRDPPAPGAGPLEVWSADSAYAVVLKDRARAPNLAAVRELSMGVWNGSGRSVGGEVWINELRLSDAVRDADLAGDLTLDLAASDVLTTRLSVSGRGGLFRQLNETPTYQDDRAVRVTSTLRLDRFAPAGWGIDVPVTVSHDRSRQDPVFLFRSDVRADRLRGLRDTESRRTRVDVAFRKRTPTADPLLGLFLDGLEARVGWYDAHTSFVTLENDAQGVDARVGYSRLLERRAVDVTPGFLDGALRWILPSFLEDRFVDADLRWTPRRISAATTWTRQESSTRRFEEILRLPGDHQVVPTLSPREGLETTAEVALEPFESVTWSAFFVSSRDLLPPDQAVEEEALQPLLRAERLRMGALDLGWETNRSLRTRLGFRPEIFSWLRSDFAWSSRYAADRNATFIEERVVGADTVRRLQRNVNGQREMNATFSLEPGEMARALLGEPADGDGAVETALQRMADAVEALRVSWMDGVVTRFNRDPVDPGAGFQFGFGSVDDFRFLGADTAATLTDRSRISAGTGVRLPLSFSVQVDYARSVATTLDIRSDRALRSRTWPDVRGGFSNLPLPARAAAVVERLGVSSGYRRQLQESSYGGRAEQRRVRSDVEVPLNVTVRWAGGVSTIYRGAFQRGEGRDPTGDTERRHQDHRLTLTSQFDPPTWMGEELDDPIRLSMGVAYRAQTDCRATVGGDACVPFVDQLNRSLNLRLDTSVQQLQVGVQAAYSDRRSFIGQRHGSTQFQLNLFGQFLFEAGSSPFVGG